MLSLFILVRGHGVICSTRTTSTVLNFLVIFLVSCSLTVINPAFSSLFIFKCKRVVLNKKIFLSTSFVGKSLRDLWEVENVLYTVKNLKTKDSEKMYFTL